MPIHEYECGDCHTQFEKLVRFSTRQEDVECPQCGARRSRQLVSLTASVGHGSRAESTACSSGGG